MAEDLMCDRTRPRACSSQAGFSMIEMLMTAFILAIGLLGLCMLQTMSLRASRGGASLTTAVHVANTVMDQVEMEGRLSWLNIADTQQSGTSNANLGLTYIPLALGTQMASTDPNPLLQYNVEGNNVIPTSTDPAVKNPFYVVTLAHVADLGGGGTIGQVSDFTVTVAFSDTSVGGKSVPRQVMLTRRILHG
jgi:prepilin-type N-terminal cleavage/methylation domain-containing protein